jgi:hypothetical protein
MGQRQQAARYSNSQSLGNVAGRFEKAEIIIAAPVSTMPYPEYARIASANGMIVAEATHGNSLLIPFNAR